MLRCIKHYHWNYYHFITIFDTVTISGVTIATIFLINIASAPFTNVKIASAKLFYHGEKPTLLFPSFIIERKKKVEKNTTSNV